MWISGIVPSQFKYSRRLTHATDRAHETLSQSNSLLSATQGTMSDFVPMWKQAEDGDVEALTRALDEEGRDPAAEAERRSEVCVLKKIL